MTLEQSFFSNVNLKCSASALKNKKMFGTTTFSAIFVTSAVLVQPSAVILASLSITLCGIESSPFSIGIGTCNRLLLKAKVEIVEINVGVV